MQEAGRKLVKYFVKLERNILWSVVRSRHYEVLIKVFDVQMQGVGRKFKFKWADQTTRFVNRITVSLFLSFVEGHFDRYFRGITIVSWVRLWRTLFPQWISQRENGIPHLPENN